MLIFNLQKFFKKAHYHLTITNLLPKGFFGIDCVCHFFFCVFTPEVATDSLVAEEVVILKTSGVNNYRTARAGLSVKKSEYVKMNDKVAQIVRKLKNEQEKDSTYVPKQYLENL